MATQSEALVLIQELFDPHRSVHLFYFKYIRKIKKGNRLTLPIEQAQAG